MKKFTKAVLNKDGLLKKIPNSEDFVVMEAFVWFVNYEQQSGEILVPKGTKTDFGSIPHIFRPFFSRNKYLAYILHDYLYEKKGVITETNGITRTYTRKESDIILREAMIVEGCPFLIAWTQYIGVRLGGWVNWNFNF